MRSVKNITYILGGALFISAAFSSCSVQKYQQPELELPDTYRADGELPVDTLNIAKMGYKDFFRDPVLINLIDKALQQNNDLKVALKQIEFASLGYRQSKWGNVPKIDATIASANINRPSKNSMNGQSLGYFLGQSYLTDYTSSINLSWEADIWGKIKGAKEEALADFLQTQEAAKAVQTRLVAEVVQGYYNLLMLDKQLEITKSNLAFADSTLTILDKQYELGMINSLAVEQQQITRDQILKSIPSIESSISVQENALSILAGSIPDKIERQSSLDNVLTPENISTGMPAEMLSYRPDVKSQELALRKSIASIHVAKVSMYPALNITAQGGLNALKASNWFNVPGSLFGLATGTIAQPILQGRQLRTRYEQAKIASEQAELNFKQSVLTAYGEVSDALVQIDKLEEQETIASGLVEKADVVVNNSLKLYQFGEATYLDVILAQSNKLQAELDLASVKSLRLNAITALYRAVGGGWQ